MFAFLSNLGSALLSAGKAVIGGCLSFTQSAGALIASIGKAAWSAILGFGGKLGGLFGVAKTATVAAAIPVMAVEGAVAAGVAEGAVILPAAIGGEALAVAGAEAMALPTVAVAAAGTSWWMWALIGLDVACLAVVLVATGRVLYKMYRDGVGFSNFWDGVKSLIWMPVAVAKDSRYLVKTGVSKTGSCIKRACTWTWSKVKGAVSTIASWFKSSSTIAEGGLARDMGMADDPDIQAADPEVAKFMGGNFNQA